MTTILLLIAVPIVWFLGVCLLLGPMMSRTSLSNQILAIGAVLVWTGICITVGIGVALSPLFL